MCRSRPLSADGAAGKGPIPENADIVFYLELVRLGNILKPFNVTEAPQ